MKRNLRIIPGLYYTFSNISIFHLNMLLIIMKLHLKIMYCIYLHIFIITIIHNKFFQLGGIYYIFDSIISTTEMCVCVSVCVHAQVHSCICLCLHACIFRFTDNVMLYSGISWTHFLFWLTFLNCFFYVSFSLVVTFQIDTYFIYRLKKIHVI